MHKVTVNNNTKHHLKADL